MNQIKYMNREITPLLPWRDRLKNWLFPGKHCPSPKAPSSYKDELVIRTMIKFSLLDRLKVLLTGRVVVITNTRTENEIGSHVAIAVSFVTTK